MTSDSSDSDSSSFSSDSESSSEHEQLRNTQSRTKQAQAQSERVQTLKIQQKGRWMDEPIAGSSESPLDWLDDSMRFLPSENEQTFLERLQIWCLAGIHTCTGKYPSFERKGWSMDVELVEYHDKLPEGMRAYIAEIKSKPEWLFQSPGTYKSVPTEEENKNTKKSTPTGLLKELRIPSLMETFLPQSVYVQYGEKNAIVVGSEVGVGWEPQYAMGMPPPPRFWSSRRPISEVTIAGKTVQQDAATKAIRRKLKKATYAVADIAMLLCLPRIPNVTHTDAIQSIGNLIGKTMIPLGSGKYKAGGEAMREETVNATLSKIKERKPISAILVPSKMTTAHEYAGTLLAALRYSIFGKPGHGAEDILRGTVRGAGTLYPIPKDKIPTDEWLIQKDAATQARFRIRAWTEALLTFQTTDNPITEWNRIIEWSDRRDPPRMHYDMPSFTVAELVLLFCEASRRRVVLQAERRRNDEAEMLLLYEGDVKRFVGESATDLLLNSNAPPCCICIKKRESFEQLPQHEEHVNTTKLRIMAEHATKTKRAIVRDLTQPPPIETRPVCTQAHALPPPPRNYEETEARRRQQVANTVPPSATAQPRGWGVAVPGQLIEQHRVSTDEYEAKRMRQEKAIQANKDARKSQQQLEAEAKKAKAEEKQKEKQNQKSSKRYADRVSGRLPMPEDKHLKSMLLTPEQEHQRRMDLAERHRQEEEKARHEAKVRKDDQRRMDRLAEKHRQEKEEIEKEKRAAEDRIWKARSERDALKLNDHNQYYHIPSPIDMSSDDEPMNMSSESLRRLETQQEEWRAAKKRREETDDLDTDIDFDVK